MGILGADARPTLEDRDKEQCFLIFREAVSNAVRHANASRIDVILEIPESGSMTLKVIDDGLGFDTHEAFEHPAGLGLSMIRERAASTGGKAEIQSTPGKGTRVEIEVPFVEAAVP